LIKKHLPIRLEPALISRLKRLAKAVNAPINDALSIDLDAMERNRSMTEAAIKVWNMLRTVWNFCKKLAALVDLVAVQNENMDRHFIDAAAGEKEGLKALYLLPRTKLSDHEAAEGSVSRT
jgi:hypothetical protein